MKTRIYAAPAVKGLKHLNQANTTCSHNAGLMLAHCLRRWPNIKPPLAKQVIFNIFIVVQYIIIFVLFQYTYSPTAQLISLEGYADAANTHTQVWWACALPTAGRKYDLTLTRHSKSVTVCGGQSEGPSSSCFLLKEQIHQYDDFFINRASCVKRVYLQLHRVVHTSFHTQEDEIVATMCE